MGTVVPAGCAELADFDLNIAGVDKSGSISKLNPCLYLSNAESTAATMSDEDAPRPKVSTTLPFLLVSATAFNKLS